MITQNKLHCKCLYEIENKLPRTKRCFIACMDQRKILFKREKEKQIKEQNINQN